MTEHSNPNKTIRELIEETRLARQAGKNFLKPDTSFTIYNEITKDQSSASGDSLIYNEITAPHLTSGDPKHESHYIIPHGYIYPLYN